MITQSACGTVFYSRKGFAISPVQPCSVDTYLSGDYLHLSCQCGVLELACNGPQSWLLNFQKFCEPVDRHHIGSLKMAMMGVLTPEKPPNTTNQGSQHSTATTTTIKHVPAHHWALTSHCLLVKNVRHQGPLCKEIGRHRGASEIMPLTEPPPASSMLLSAPAGRGGFLSLLQTLAHLNRWKRTSDSRTKPTWKWKAQPVLWWQLAWLFKVREKILNLQR